MSRKHFILLAAAIAKVDTDPHTKRELALDVANLCRESNPRFDRLKFMRACGVES